MRSTLRGIHGPQRTVFLLLAAGSAQLAFAQTPPDAGSLLQQNEARKPAPLPEKKPSLRAPESKPSSVKPGVTVLVHSFKLVGNTLIASEVLQPLLASYVGRRLNLAELQAAAGLISDAYAAQGWLARCYLPAQDTTAGVIELRVVEARFGGVRVEGKSRIDSARAERIVLAQQAQGDFVQLPALERGLLLVDDLAGTRANGALVAGQLDGQTQLAMTLSETPLFSGEVSLDNGGARSTGSTRLNGAFALSSALGLGEQFTAQLTHSRGSDYARLGAAVPLGDHGWRLGAGVSGLHYRLTDFQGLEGHGSTEGADVNLSYPIVRSRRLNLNAQLGFESRRFDNEANGSATTKYRSSAATLGFNGNAFDDWHGGGVTLGSLGLSQGRLNLNGSPNFDLDAQTTQANGDFNVLRYSLSREQRLDGTFTAYLAASGQWSTKNLDSSEKFYLGGPYGVRAYPSNEAGGSIGQLVRAELRATLPRGWSMAGFYDWGQVTQNANNQFEDAPKVNRYALQGAGLGAAWSGPHSIELRGTLAHPIGHNAGGITTDPNQAGERRNQDGTKPGWRLWVQASLQF